MKSILFILPYLPYPLKSGGHQAIFNGIKAVADNYKVFITYDANENDSSAQKELKKLFGQNINIIPFKNDPEKQSFALRFYIKYWNTKEHIKKILKIRSKVSPPCFSQIQIDNINKISFINNLISENHIEIVQCEMIPCISEVLTLPANLKKIYIQHQIDYVRYKLDLREQKTFSIYQDNYIRSKQNEIFLLNRYDAIVALSEHDKNIMEQDGVIAPIYVSPAIITSTPIPYNNEPKKKILSFVGPSFHYPNANGIFWFLENCWRQLKKIDNEYLLQIIGEWQNNYIRDIQRKYDDVQFCGFVPSLADKIKNTIMIVPINIGSGIRMKILEAVTLSIPVVSTTIGAQGLPLTDQEDCYITDNSQTFVNDILKLRDDEIQRKLTQNAQNKILEKYSFSSFKQTRLKIYE